MLSFDVGRNRPKFCQPLFPYMLHTFIPVYWMFAGVFEHEPK